MLRNDVNCFFNYVTSSYVTSVFDAPAVFPEAVYANDWSHVLLNSNCVIMQFI